MSRIVPQTEFFGSLLSLGVALAAILLIGWGVAERRSRSDDRESEDGRHFARQELRRAVVAVIMLVASAGIFLGAHLSPKTNERPNLLFVEVWLAVFGLVLVLLVSALIDWTATRRYARRQRQAIVREAVESLRLEMIRRSKLSDGGSRSVTNAEPFESGDDLSKAR